MIEFKPTLSISKTLFCDVRAARKRQVSLGGGGGAQAESGGNGTKRGQENETRGQPQSRSVYHPRAFPFSFPFPFPFYFSYSILVVGTLDCFLAFAYICVHNSPKSCLFWIAFSSNLPYQEALWAIVVHMYP